VPSNKDFKTTPEMKEENEAFKAVDEVERIMKAISLVKGQVAIIEAAMDIFKKDFDERMDKLGEYLKDKTIVE
jgi:predicted hydrolase (HD superfamily)